MEIEISIKKGQTGSKLYLTKEKISIKTLQRGTAIIMLPVGKGNAQVMIDKLKYSEKLTSLVGGC